MGFFGLADKGAVFKAGAFSGNSIFADCERAAVVKIKILAGGNFLVHKLSAISENIKIKDEKKEGGKDDNKDNDESNDFIFVQFHKLERKDNKT